MLLLFCRIDELSRGLAIHITWKSPKAAALLTVTVTKIRSLPILNVWYRNLLTYNLLLFSSLSSFIYVYITRGSGLHSVRQLKTIGYWHALRYLQVVRCLYAVRHLHAVWHFHTIWHLSIATLSPESTAHSVARRTSSIAIRGHFSGELLRYRLCLSLRKAN